MEPSAAPAAPNAENPAVANETQMTVASKVAQMTDMLAKLVSVLAPPNQVDNTREPSGPRAQSPGTGHPFCWECGRPGHFQKSCPELQSRLNYHGPQTLPPPAGCREFPREDQVAAPRWASLSNLTERSPTRQVGSSSHSPPAFSVPPATELTNCGSQRLRGKQLGRREACRYTLRSWSMVVITHQLLDLR